MNLTTVHSSLTLYVSLCNMKNAMHNACLVNKFSRAFSAKPFYREFYYMGGGRIPKSECTGKAQQVSVKDYLSILILIT